MSISHLLTPNNYDLLSKSIKIGDGDAPITRFYETENFSYSVSGGIESGHFLQGNYTVLNNIVFMKINNLYESSSSSNSTIITSVGVVPSNLLPINIIYHPVMVWNNSGIFIGTCKINTNGQITLYVSNNNNFVNSGNNGITPNIISWTIN
jgi:hypothetical protein